MADGLIQVPPDSTGKKVDAASLDVGANSVIRQRIILADNSATAAYATVTNGALTVTGNINISATAQVAISTPFTVNDISRTVAIAGTVALGAGAANIGFINNISATVNVAFAGGISLAAGTANIGILNNISATVLVAGVVSLAAGTANIGFINHVSATVVVATSNPYILAVPSASHGPQMVIASTSANVTLIANPGAGNSIHITQLLVTNSGQVDTLIRIGTSASGTIMAALCKSGGGGFAISFDPPWRFSASEQAVCSVKPNSSGNTYFNVNFFIAP